VHDSLPLTVAVCPVESLFVHVMVSPTLAVTCAGSNAKLAILTDTVPVASDGAHGAAAADAGALAGASLAGASLAGASLAGVALCGATDGAVVAAVPAHALAMNTANTTKGRILARDIVASSALRARSSQGYVDVYAAVGRAVS
jgi:hypothetical protein